MDPKYEVFNCTQCGCSWHRRQDADTCDHGVERKKVTITLDEKDMDYIEDAIFCVNSEEEMRIMRPRLNRIWMDLCDEMETATPACRNCKEKGCIEENGFCTNCGRYQ